VELYFVELGVVTELAPKLATLFFENFLIESKKIENEDVLKIF
jgi:hypothetical protein